MCRQALRHGALQENKILEPTCQMAEWPHVMSPCQSATGLSACYRISYLPADMEIMDIGISIFCMNSPKKPWSYIGTAHIHQSPGPKSFSNLESAI